MSGATIGANLLTSHFLGVFSLFNFTGYRLFIYCCSLVSRSYSISMFLTLLTSFSSTGNKQDYSVGMVDQVTKSLSVIISDLASVGQGRPDGWCRDVNNRKW